VPEPVDLTTFRAKIEARKQREREERQAEQITPTFDADLVPEKESRSEADEELDRIIDKIDIIDAYNKWCGKMRPEVRGGQVEGIKISCPIPSHPDKDPSAWINLEKQTWFCGGCQVGGDAMDIAAYHFGYPVPGYKEGAKFHELRRDMAKSYGYTFHKLVDGNLYVSAPESEPEPTPEVPPHEGILPEDFEPTEEGAAKVVQLFEQMEDEDIVFPHLEWQEVVPEQTFLSEYMKACIQDDVTEEFHFWNGLIALGLALGRDVRLFDMVPVFGNLFVCTLGHSGSGKSKAKYHLEQLLVKALPYKQDDPGSKGVKKVSSPASAEVLVQSFQKLIPDPANPKIVAYNAPVRGLIDYAELSGMIGRGNRMGSVLKPTMMQFYDMEPVISTVSLTSGNKEAKEPFACALTTTQPRALRDLLGRGDDSSGFLTRWVFATGPEKERVAIGGYRVDVTPAVGPLEDVVGWAGSFGADEMVQWSEEAAQLYTDFFHSTIEPDKRRAETELITRIDLTIKKLILLFTANLRLKTVPIESVEAAIKCYPYLTASYMIPAGQIGNTLQHEIREAVAYQARKHEDGISMSEIARALKRRKYPLDLMKKVIELMVSFGELEMKVTNVGKVGRPTEKFRYVG
jgi:hypothetical protein